MTLFLRLYRGYLTAHVRVLALLLAVAMLSSLSSFTLTYLSKIMVDDVLRIEPPARLQDGGPRVLRDRPLTAPSDPPARERESGRREPAPPWVGRASQVRLLWIVFGCYVGLRILFAGLGWAYTYGITQVGQQVVYHLRRDIYTKLQSLQVSYFDRFRTGKIMARVMDDVNAVESSISSVFIRMITDVTTVLIGMVLLYGIDTRLAFLCTLTLPCYVLVYRVFIEHIRTTNRVIRERNAALYGTIGDSVNGVRVVMSFARELRELRRFFSDLSDFLRLQMRNARLNTALSVLCGLVSGVGSTLVVYLGILSIRDGSMTLGDFLFFYGSIGYLFTPVVSLSNLNINIQWVSTALTRVFDVLDEQVTIVDRRGARALPEVHGEVVFHNVSLSYDGSREALHRINFGVLPGQTVCIVGPSGAGKTSLVNLLLRMYDPTEGRITLDGEDIQDIALTSLRRHVRMVPQEPMLFSGTLAENIRYGQPGAPPESVMRAARAAELHDHIMSLPAKYETHIGESGVSLSGGQKQRMALAMTLMTNPSVLILDDSTSALDADTEARIHRTLQQILESRTAFIITHKLAVARRADLVLVLENGRLVEFGTHPRLVARRAAYYRLFEAQLTEDEKQEPQPVR